MIRAVIAIASKLELILKCKWELSMKILKVIGKYFGVMELGFKEDSKNK